MRKRHHKLSSYEKRTKRVLGLGGITLLLGLGFYIWLITANIPNPKRINNIPKSAVWKGGADGGFWFDVVAIDSIEKTYRIKIYNDYNGGMVIEADFTKDSNCNNEYPLNEGVLKEINLFDFHKIHMLDNCKLNMIKPAYGGSFWEMDKDIYKQTK